MIVFKKCVIDLFRFFIRGQRALFYPACYQDYDAVSAVFKQIPFLFSAFAYIDYMIHLHASRACG